jgi:hypothetical protein
MRRAVTFVVHGNKYELIFDPAVSVTEQKNWIKRTMQTGLVCDCIEHWTTDGEKRQFHPPRPAKPKAPAKKSVVLKV